MRHYALLALLLGGCSWVTPSDLDCQLQLVDDDADGYPLNQVEEGYEGNDRCSHLEALDCDDGAAEIHPEAEESWYDGIDADCALDDDYDQDQDGYVADGYQGLTTEGVDGTGELPGGDCDDTSGSINADGTDVWYDGVDTDCSGNDDYDQDEDGYVLDEYEGLETAYADGTGSLPAGDCDDVVATVNPAADDSAYDGLDSDCSGNDDYDQDEDGYVLDDYVGLATIYVDGSGALPGGDCDDSDARIHTGAIDEWYDGVDSDCVGDDDYDQDVDGYRDAVTAKDGDDCDDLDPTSFPGATESFADPVDHDCDGGSQTFALADAADLSWVSPQSLVFRGTESTLYLGVSAEELVYGSTDYWDTALALSIDAVDPSGGHDEALVWLRNYSDPHPNVLTPGTDLYPTDEWLYAAVGIQTSSTRQIVVRAWELATTTTYATNPPITASLSFDDVTLTMDPSGNLHAVGCSESEHDESMVYLWAQPATLQNNTYDDTFGLPTRANTCDLDFFDASGDGTLIVSRIVGTSAPTGDTGDTGPPGPSLEVRDLGIYTFTPAGEGESTLFLEQGSVIGYEVASLQVYQDGTGRQLVIADATANTLTVLGLDETFRTMTQFEHEFGSDPLVKAASAKGPDDMIYVLAATESGSTTLLYGIPGVMPTLREVPFDLGFIVEHVAVWVDDAGSFLFLAAAGFDPAAGADRVTYGYAEL